MPVGRLAPMGSTSAVVCGVNSAGWRYNSAGFVGWRMPAGTVEGPLLHSVACTDRCPGQFVSTVFWVPRGTWYPFNGTVAVYWYPFIGTVTVYWYPFIGTVTVYWYPFNGTITVYWYPFNGTVTAYGYPFYRSCVVPVFRYGPAFSPIYFYRLLHVVWYLLLVPFIH